MATDPTTVFVVDLAALAREIAMDIFPIEQVLEIHKLADDEWQKILAMPKFQAMLAGMQVEWQSAMHTRDRVKAKAATGLESQLEIYVAAIGDEAIPLTQRVEAGKFLARLGELDGMHDAKGIGSGGSVTINITTSSDKPTITLTATPSPVLDLVEDAEIER